MVSGMKVETGEAKASGRRVVMAAESVHARVLYLAY